MTTNFAATFGAIFKDIFGECPLKPRIFRCFGGGWACRSLDGNCGFGATPSIAYQQWRTAPMVINRTPGWIRSPQAAKLIRKWQ